MSVYVSEAIAYTLLYYIQYVESLLYRHDSHIQNQSFVMSDLC